MDTNLAPGYPLEKTIRLGLLQKQRLSYPAAFPRLDELEKGYDSVRERRDISKSTYPSTQY